VRAGLETGYPYLGFALPQPDDLLKRLQEPLVQDGRAAIVDQSDVDVLNRLLRRLGVTHLVGHRRSWLGLGTELGRWRDGALDRIIYHAAGEPASRVWSLVRLDEPFAEARVVVRLRTVSDRRALVERLSRSDDRSTAWCLAEDRVPERPDARSARLVAWDGAAATVEHDGPCDLVIARTFDPGWRAESDAGPAPPVFPVDGGLLAVRLDGSGVHRVAMDYRPPGLALWAAISMIAAVLDLGLAAGAFLRRIRALPRF
jgi:hypothetical protein